MNKNRKTYMLYGFGPGKQIIAWDGQSSSIELLNPDLHEWIDVTVIGG